MADDASHSAAAVRLAALPTGAARRLIRLYQLTLSGLIGRQCRHLPTCSEYTDESIARFGVWAGAWMGFARLARCHPFGTSGFDPVPTQVDPKARWYTPWRYGRWRGTEPAANGET